MGNKISALPRLETDAVEVVQTATGFGASIPITHLDDLPDADGPRRKPLTGAERQARYREGIRDGSMALHIWAPRVFIEAAIETGLVGESESEDKRVMKDVVRDYLDKAGRGMLRVRN